MEKRQMFIIITELCSERRSDKFRRMKGKEKLKEGRKDRRGRSKGLGMLSLLAFFISFSLYSISAKLKVTDKEGSGADHCRHLKLISSESANI